MQPIAASTAAQPQLHAQHGTASQPGIMSFAVSGAEGVPGMLQQPGMQAVGQEQSSLPELSADFLQPDALMGDLNDWTGEPCNMPDGW